MIVIVVPLASIQMQQFVIQTFHWNEERAWRNEISDSHIYLLEIKKVKDRLVFNIQIKCHNYKYVNTVSKVLHFISGWGVSTDVGLTRHHLFLKYH